MKKGLFYNFFLFIIIAAFIFAIFNFTKRNEYTEVATRKTPVTIDISEAPIYELEEDENKEVLYKKSGVSQKIIYKNQRISHLFFSPNKNKAGFFYESGNYLSAGRDTALAIVNISDKKIKKVYEGSFKTSGWEWVDDNEVLVYYGCGTECMVTFVIDANSGERKAQLQYGVGYEWSPNKKYVLAYNYSGKYGITVGNKEEKVLLSIKRDSDYSKLVDETTAIWSPDSSKLAVIIKKEKIEEMEILVFETDNFDMILQSDIEFTKDAKFIWAGNNKISFNNKEFLIE